MWLETRCNNIRRGSSPFMRRIMLLLIPIIPSGRTNQSWSKTKVSDKMLLLIISEKLEQEGLFKNSSRKMT
jgi:hypothetical protein